MFSDADFPSIVFFPHPTWGKRDQHLLPELVWQEERDDFWGTCARHSVPLLRPQVSRFPVELTDSGRALAERETREPQLLERRELMGAAAGTGTQSAVT